MSSCRSLQHSLITHVHIALTHCSTLTRSLARKPEKPKPPPTHARSHHRSRPKRASRTSMRSARCPDWTQSCLDRWTSRARTVSRTARAGWKSSRHLSCTLPCSRWGHCRPWGHCTHSNHSNTIAGGREKYSVDALPAAALQVCAACKRSGVHCGVSTGDQETVKQIMLLCDRIGWIHIGVSAQ